MLTTSIHSFRASAVPMAVPTKPKPKAKRKTLLRKPAQPLIAMPITQKKTAPPISELKKLVTQFVQAAPIVVKPKSIETAPAEPKPKSKRRRVSQVQPADYGKLPEHGFVRVPKILEVYPISRAGWWAGVKDGTLPAGVLLSSRVRAWAVEDIRRLIADAKTAG